MKALIFTDPSCLSGQALALFLKLRFGPGFKIALVPSTKNQRDYGVQIAPNSMKAFRTLRLLNNVIGAGSRLELGQVGRVDGASSSTPFLTDPKRLERRNPLMGVKLSEMVNLLQDALQKARINQVVTSRPVAIHGHQDNVVVDFEDGSNVDADFVFACDGAESVVGKLMGRRIPAMDQVCYTGFAPLDKSPSKSSDSISMALPDAAQHIQEQLMVDPKESIGNWRGASSQFIHFPISEEEMAWFVRVPNTGEMDKNHLMQHLSSLSWKPSFLDVLDSSTSFEKLYYPKWNPVEKDVWTDNRIWFLGQAAHPGSSPPFMDQHLSLGIEDAGLVVRALHEHIPYANDVVTAKSVYERVRQTRVNWIGAQLSSIAESDSQAGLSSDMSVALTVKVGQRYPSARLINTIWNYDYRKQLVM